MVVRLFYSIRRLIGYYSKVQKENRSFTLLWQSCEPFSNATVKRMLTVAHGTFCLVDLGDATIRGFATGGGYFNVAEFFMRVNIIGVGRFTISLYGEAKRGILKHSALNDLSFIQRERVVVTYYIEGLQQLAKAYDDDSILSFVNDLQNSELYIEAFNKTVKLAEIRKVPEKDILKTKSDIDSYFLGGTHK